MGGCIAIALDGVEHPYSVISYPSEATVVGFHVDDKVAMHGYVANSYEQRVAVLKTSDGTNIQIRGSDPHKLAKRHQPLAIGPKLHTELMAHSSTRF